MFVIWRNWIQLWKSTSRGIIQPVMNSRLRAECFLPLLLSNCSRNYRNTVYMNIKTYLKADDELWLLIHCSILKSLSSACITFWLPFEPETCCDGRQNGMGGSGRLEVGGVDEEFQWINPLLLLWTASNRSVFLWQNVVQFCSCDLFS